MLTTKECNRRSRGLWIAWEHHLRNLGISEALNWRLVEIDLKYSRLLRYPPLIFATFVAVLKERPDIVAGQNPSLVLSVLLILLRPLFRYTLVIDAHNAGIYPFEGRVNAFLRTARWIQKKADITVVTNEELAKEVLKNKGTPFVLPDRLPTVPALLDTFSLEPGINVAYICTYVEDEPYREVLAAAQKLPVGITLYFTGRFNGKLAADLIPKNVKLLGFLPEREYWSLLHSADIVMDLTLREHCLVCGAYEGVALGKPLVLSDTEALKSYFSKGCVYVKPCPNSIASGIKQATEKLSSMAAEVKSLRQELHHKWQRSLRKFKALLRSC